jgi:hypothetical protein
LPVVTAPLPPELLTPEDREARALELEHQVTREWIRFAILDNVLILAIVGVGLLYALADAISWGAFVVALIVLGGVMIGLALYWVFRRVRPLQDEIAALRAER